MRKLALILTPLIFLVGTAWGSDITLVVLDGKLIKADKVVDPQITISTGAPVAMGELVVIEAKLTNEAPDFVKKKVCAWDVTEGGYKKQCWGDDQKVVFGAGMKRAVIHVAIRVDLTYQVGTTEIVKTVTGKQDIQVGDSPPDPNPPGPGPSPNPNPPGPTPTPPTPTPPTPPTPPAPPAPDLTGVAKMARDWATMTVTTLPAPDVVSSAHAMAMSFRQVAARIGHDASVDNARKILTATKQSNNTALQGVHVDAKAWDQWGVLLQEYLYQQYQAKSLLTPDQYKDVWNQIAQGLDSIK